MYSPRVLSAFTRDSLAPIRDIFIPKWQVMNYPGQQRASSRKDDAESFLFPLFICRKWLNFVWSMAYEF
jgi:hypothetical protein